MSEGDTFLHKAIYDISLLIRDPNASPVQGAEDLIRRFCTKELRGVEGGVEGVEDYVANAVVDLVLMSTWSIAATQLGVGNLPVSPGGPGDWVKKRGKRNHTDDRHSHSQEIFERVKCCEKHSKRTKEKCGKSILV